MNKNLTLALAAAGLLATSALSHAVTIYGLTTTNGLVRFDSATPNIVTTIGTITANGGVGTIADIDFYPVNGLLYAFNTAGVGYRINLTTAAATQVITPGATFDGQVADVDFNPVADRIRVFTTGTTTQNYRMFPDVDTAGALAGAGTVVVDGAFTPTGSLLVANAYTNNFDGAASTTLYSIDTNGDRLMVHSGTPQFNTITVVGSLGIAVGSDVGFDIDGNTSAYLSNGAALYTVNLQTGATASLGTVAAPTLKSIAVVIPEPSTALLVGLALVGTLVRRRRAAA